ncbi:metal-dependent hydrolase [Mycobacteroides sp. LB1]|uniref:metal-dependent hydrolase n=1 Tax=Mycobacteroides sp. LB1 TaxID=2750814 RepID=UPI0015DDF047|nr:metal-dependent hydrolase [Mycobacteroides sp. LB1]
METPDVAPPVDAGHVALHARNVTFDFSHSPLTWVPGEPIASYALSALNLMLPVGEQMFVDVFSRALPYIKDERLREDVIGFIGQEKMHSDTHDHALREYFTQHGIDLSVWIKHSEQLFEQFQKRMDSLPPKLQYRVMVQGVTMIAGLEHLTSTAGDWLLNFDFEKFGADPVITDMFRWHGAEEVEHRSVAWNLARYFGASRTRLMVYYLASCVPIVGGLVTGGWLLARADPSLPKFGARQFARELRLAMKREATLSFALLGKAFKAYLRPDFTPEAIGDTAQAVAYLAKSPAAKAATAA